MYTTRFHVQERHIQLVKFCNLYLQKHIIWVNKYKFLIFAGFSLHLDKVKKALLLLQIQLEILGRVEIYLITSTLGFSSLRKMTFVPSLLYQPIYAINPLSQKKQESPYLKLPFVVDKA